MTDLVRRARQGGAAATRRGSPPTRARPDDSTATSAPVPTATPRSAAASAGASLIPSPTIATTRPADLSSATIRALSAGRGAAVHMVGRDTDGSGDRRGGIGSVYPRRAKRRCRPSSDLGLPRRIGPDPDPHEEGVGGSRVDRDHHASLPLVCRLWLDDDAKGLLEQPGVADHHTMAVHGGAHAASGSASEVLDRLETRARLMLAYTTMAAPSGCSLPRSTDAARSTVSLDEARLDHDLPDVGRPRVSVPVFPPRQVGRALTFSSPASS